MHVGVTLQELAGASSDNRSFIVDLILVLWFGRKSINFDTQGTCLALSPQL